MYASGLRNLAFLAAAALLASGCHRPSTADLNPYEPLPKDPGRDTDLARRHNARAAQLLGQGQLDQAEKELHAALAADLFFGPAHNNLGTVYYRQEKFYLAAWEFQYASQLMTAKAQPRNNLGMVFEAVGKLDDAAKWYEAALAIEPESLDTTANLARVYTRQNRTDDRTRDLLHQIVLKDPRPTWIQWARQRLALLGAAKTQATERTSDQPPEN